VAAAAMVVAAAMVAAVVTVETVDLANAGIFVLLGIAHVLLATDMTDLMVVVVPPALLEVPVVPGVQAQPRVVVSLHQITAQLVLRIRLLQGIRLVPALTILVR
jgi:hypothetical protein